MPSDDDEALTMSMRDEIRAALAAHGPMTAAELHPHVPSAETAEKLAANLYTWRREGGLVRDEDKRYALAAAAAREAALREQGRKVREAKEATQALLRSEAAVKVPPAEPLDPRAKGRAEREEAADQAFIEGVEAAVEAAATIPRGDGEADAPPVEPTNSAQSSDPTDARFLRGLKVRAEENAQEAEEMLSEYIEQFGDEVMKSLWTAAQRMRWAAEDLALTERRS